MTTVAQIRVTTQRKHNAQPHNLSTKTTTTTTTQTSVKEYGTKEQT
jgi:hypothetical protein